MDDIFRNETVYKMFTKNELFNEDVEQTSVKNIEDLIDTCLELLNKPVPPIELQPYIYNTEILFLLLIDLWNKLSYEKRKDLIDKHRGIKNIGKTLPQERIKYRFRILNPQGTYSNRPFSIDTTVLYTNINGMPVLITKENLESDSYTSEISILNEYELLASIGVILNSPRHRLHFVFDDKSITVSKELYESIPEKLKYPFISEMISLFIKIQSPEMYRYSDHSESEISTMIDSIKSIKLTDEAFLRTAFLTMKGRMLWQHRIFGEDAITNVFFALEGTLHLIQKAYGKDIRRLDFTFLKKVFKDNIERGEELLDFIKEAYDKRTEIVHPVRDNGSNWCPFLIADDFYEYYEIVIDLLNHYIKKVS